MTGLHTLTAHSWYAWTGVLLVFFLWFRFRSKFQVTIIAPDAIYDGEKCIDRPGSQFMPWEHRVVSVATKTLIVGGEQLVPNTETITTKRGETNEWQRVTNLAQTHHKPPIIVYWRPDLKKLGRFLVPATPFSWVEDHLTKILRADPDTELQKYADMIGLGIVICEVKRPAKKKTGGSVTLADDVDIPYEG